jgi:hypothetical protein
VGPNLINNGFPTLCTLPKAVLPAGYQAFIGWANTAPTTGLIPDVTGAFWELRDNNGNQVGNASTRLSTLSGGNVQAPIVAFELNIVGPVNGESAVLSSGAGYISYVALEPAFSARVGRPTQCTETSDITCETANTIYGPLPSNSNLICKHYFNVNDPKAMVHAEGQPRPSTKLSTADLQKILGGAKS